MQNCKICFSGRVGLESANIRLGDGAGGYSPLNWAEIRFIR